MHAGQQTNMKRGAIAACVLPMALGVFGLLATFQNLSTFYTGRSFSDSPHFFTLPIVLCFLFGPPLTAYLACSHLKKIRNLEQLRRWQTTTGRAVLTATSVHFWSALVYTIIALIFFFPDGDSMEGVVIGVIGVLIMSGLINLILWVIITLPFTLFCTIIFRLSTTFPKDS